LSTDFAVDKEGMMLDRFYIVTDEQEKTEQETARTLALAWSLGFDASAGALVVKDGKFCQTVWTTPRRNEPA